MWGWPGGLTCPQQRNKGKQGAEGRRSREAATPSIRTGNAQSQAVLQSPFIEAQLENFNLVQISFDLDSVLNWSQLAFLKLWSEASITVKLVEVDQSTKTVCILITPPVRPHICQMWF